MTIKLQSIDQTHHKIDKDVNPEELLKNISAQDFLGLGVHDVAYIRPINTNGKIQYSIHAADGTQLSVMDDENSAIGTIIQNDMNAVTLH